MTAKAEAARLDAEVAELAAEKRRQDEPAHARQREVWTRNADRPEREKKAQAARGFDAFLRACKFTPAEIADLRPVAWVILKAAGGTDPAEYFTLPDAIAGALLEGWAGADIEGLRERGKGHPDHERLARKWVRAVKRCAPALARTRLQLFDRKHGYKRAAGNVASKICAPFVQWLVETDKAATTLGIRSLELRYQRAAELVVNALPRTTTFPPDGTFACPACQSDDCPHARGRGPRADVQREPAACCVKFLGKLQELVDKTLADVPAEMRAELYEPARKLLLSRLTGEEPEDEQKGATCAEIAQPERTEAAKHAAANEIRVDKFVTHNPPAAPFITADEIFIPAGATDEDIDRIYAGLYAPAEQLGGQ